ncbi:hypothetical protein MUK42_30507 [Musa troglodytarum]|uniref:Uncharacterized protein n=1 Tax=Musa troglodytarum TaxID=320322 RepID=A0A9E7F2I2_9LILI|nr:hypothetical protein MUK42_30507 [Musa troglodytarum]
MSTSGSGRWRRRRRASLWLALLLVTSFWRCFEGREAATATRLFPLISGGHSGGHAPVLGRRPSPLSPSTAAAGVEDSKRRVPSCPDPLHNRR